MRDANHTAFPSHNSTFALWFAEVSLPIQNSLINTHTERI